MEQELYEALNRLMGQAKRVWIEREPEYATRTPDEGWIQAWNEAEAVLLKARPTLGTSEAYLRHSQQPGEASQLPQNQTS